jgi:hypothetical protein
MTDSWTVGIGVRSCYVCADEGSSVAWKRVRTIEVSYLSSSVNLDRNDSGV